MPGHYSGRQLALILKIGGGPKTFLVSVALFKIGERIELLQAEMGLDREEVEGVFIDDVSDVALRVISNFVEVSDCVISPDFKNRLTREFIKNCDALRPLLALPWHDPTEWSPRLCHEVREDCLSAGSVQSAIRREEVEMPGFVAAAMDDAESERFRQDPTLYAAKVHYMERDLARQCGFTWDYKRKSWVRNLTADELLIFPFECVPLEVDEDY